VCKEQDYKKGIKTLKIRKLPFDGFRDDEFIIAGKEDFGITTFVILLTRCQEGTEKTRCL
jgi:hypothetical protein